MVAARSRGHGAARRMFFRAVADMMPAFSAGLSGKMLRQGLRFVCTSARHECLPPRSRFLPAMAKTSVRRARTPHRGDAHNARLTPLHRGGKDRELSMIGSYQLCRKESRTFPQRDSICRSLVLCGKVNARALSMLRIARAEENRAVSRKACPRGCSSPLTTLCYRSISQKDFHKSFLR